MIPVYHGIESVLLHYEKSSSAHPIAEVTPLAVLELILLLGLSRERVHTLLMRSVPVLWFDYFTLSDVMV